MDKAELYAVLAERKSKPKDFQPYAGDNGRVNKCLELMRSGKIKRGEALLDVGGGIGDLSYGARDLYPARFTLDISHKNLSAGKSKDPEGLFVWGDVDASGLLAASSVGLEFDTVTALDFIEHIVDPENFARECFRVLKPGGQVFINTPNIQYWEHMRKLVFEGSFPHTSGDREVYHGGHLAFFTFNDLYEIFGKTGFVKCEQVHDSEGYRQPPDFWLQTQQVKSQEQYKIACERLGNPNLLFLCEKP